MADSKRQSIGGNRSGTTTPKPVAKGPTATGPSELDYSKVIGAHVRIATSAPASTFEGIVFTACPNTNIMALNTAPNAATSVGGASNYKIVPISRIQTFTLLSTPAAAAEATTPSVSAAFENARPSITRIDVKVLQAREEAAVRKLKEKDATKGKGVTKEAQDIFDALYRTLPARWHGEDIIVNDTVRIAPPYTPEDCTAVKDQQTNLLRVRKVLENERKKLALRTTEERTSIPKADGKPVGIARNPMVATPYPRKGG